MCAGVLAVAGWLFVAAGAGAELDDAFSILDPSAPLEPLWEVQAFDAPDTLYEVVEFGGEQRIRASGMGTASGLVRKFVGGAFHAQERPFLEWDWHVQQIQPSADIRDREKDDFGASVYVLFGKAGFFKPAPPTLAYVWSNDKVAVGDMFASPRGLANLRFFVLQTQARDDGVPVFERRNLLEDYRRAFNEEPRDAVSAIAVWTDSDQTGEAVVSHYGPIRAVRE